MNLPMVSQVTGKSSSSRTNILLHRYPLTKSEALKVDANLKNQKKIWELDTPHSFNQFLNLLDNVFGDFRTIHSNKVTYRGKLEYKSTTTDQQTGEKQIILILSDPKTLYRKMNTNPIYLRVPFSPTLKVGGYVEVDIYPSDKHDTYVYFTELKNITPINVELKMPTLFLDYSKFNDVFKLEYGFDLSDTGQKYKRNLDLSNIDLILLNKIAGENFHDEVKGGVNCNLIKTTHDQGTYNLEVLDHFLDTITFNQKTKTVFNSNLINSGNLGHFSTILHKNNRQMTLTPFKNYYGCNIGYSLGSTLHAEEDKIMEKLSDTCIDYLNPIGNITTLSNSVVKKLLKIDKPYVYSSKALLLETQLLPIQVKISNVATQKPNVLRMATMLNKFENCIDDLGTDEVLRKITLKDSSIDSAIRFIKNNVKDTNEFIKSR